MASLATSTDFLLWKYVSDSDIATLADSFDPEVCKSQLNSCLLPPAAKSLPPQASSILTNFFFYSYAFCKNLGLSPPKVSTFLGIVRTIVAHDIGLPYSPSHTLKQSHDLFTSLLLRHSVERSPFSMKVFEKDDVGHIGEFVLQQYYRMWRVYKVACCVRVQVRIDQLSNGVEVGGGGGGLGRADEEDLVVLFPEQEEVVVVAEEEKKADEGEGGEGEGA